MNGPSSNEREKLDNRLKWAQHWLEAAGAVVVFGLLVEYGPQIWQSIKACRTLPREVTGGVLITLGVAVEVFLGILIARYSDCLQTLAQFDVAKAIERSAKAEQAAAEANLARVQLERRLTKRDLSDEQRDAMAEKLSKFAGQNISIRAFPINNESMWFATVVCIALKQADWHVELTTLNTGCGIYADGFVLLSTSDERTQEAGKALLIELSRNAGRGVLAPLLGDAGEPRLELIVQDRPALTARAEETPLMEPPQA